MAPARKLAQSGSLQYPFAPMHRPSRIEWDDLRYALAVAEHGSLASAARALGVNHTTVLRRVNAFEETQGLRLFDRLASGYALTAGGEQLLGAARQMAGVVADLERKLAGQDLRLEGTLRVATTDTLIDGLLPPILASFHQAHPAIAIEVIAGSQFANLSKRDADVAIRPASSPTETLVGRKVCAIGFAVYRAPHYPMSADPPHRWVAPDDSLSATTAARWMAAEQRGADIVLRANSFLTLCRAAASGHGLAVLPCYLGDPCPGVARVPEFGRPPSSELWVLTHEDLRGTARVRAFTDHVTAALLAQRTLIEG